MINNSTNNIQHPNSKVNIQKNFFKQNPLEIYGDNYNQNMSLDIRTTLEHQTSSTRPYYMTKIHKQVKNKSISKDYSENKNIKRETRSPDVDYLFKKFQKHIKLGEKKAQQKKPNIKNFSNSKEKKKIPLSKKVPVKLFRPRPLTMGCNDFEYME